MRSSRLEETLESQGSHPGMRSHQASNTLPAADKVLNLPSVSLYSIFNFKSVQTFMFENILYLSIKGNFQKIKHC